MIIKRIPILILLLLAGCSQSFYSQGRKFVEREQYDRAVDSFYKEIAANPQSAAAWRELGVAYYKMGEYDKADDALKQAGAIAPDARSQMFLGLILERREEYAKALDAYAAALNLEPRKKTRNMVRAHIDRLLYQKVSREVSSVIENESAISTDTIPENTIAVVNFDGSHLDAETAPIAVGLAEFTSADLAKVKDLKVVERLKIDLIMDELALSKTGFIDPSSAPRFGRLLGTNRIVTGSLLGIGEEGFRLDGIIVNTADSAAMLTRANEGDLKDIFSIQKQFVFGLIDELGITLTADERDAIREVPTESYLAFMSYCRGRHYQQQGMHQIAQQEFNNAMQYDANFMAAAAQFQKSAAAGAGDSYEAGMQAMESFALGEGAAELAGDGLDTRITTVVDNAGLIPDGGTRRPADAQPRITGTGRVIIKVNFDND